MSGSWERYLLLGLRLGRHVDGLVDAYFGPAELAARVEREELVPPGELAAEARALRLEAETAWLRAQLEGGETTARRLAGGPLGWAEEVERCYGVAPAHTDESRFEEAHRRLDAALPGPGDVGERYRAWAEAQELPADRLLDASSLLAEALRSRTRELFGLPEDED